MSTLLTPEHFQLLSTRRLRGVVDKTETTDETTQRMARYELQRRECTVPVRQRYDSVAAITAERQKSQG